VIPDRRADKNRLHFDIGISGARTVSPESVPAVMREGGRGKCVLAVAGLFFTNCDDRLRVCVMHDP
jgi:hypothetical protein